MITTRFLVGKLYEKGSCKSIQKMTIEICGKISGQYCRQRLPSENLHHGRNLAANDFRKEGLRKRIICKPLVPGGEEEIHSMRPADLQEVSFSSNVLNSAIRAKHPSRINPHSAIGMGQLFYG
jgi:hypothetical protein